MISIDMPTYPQTHEQRQHPKSIFKNPERNCKNENKIKKVRFLEDCKKYNNKYLISIFLIILLIISAILYLSFKDKFNQEHHRLYIRQILDYISLVTIKIKSLIYKTDQ